MERKDQKIRLSEIFEISRLIKNPEVDEFTKKRAVNRLTELALKSVNSDLPNNQLPVQVRDDIEIEYDIRPRTPDEFEQAINQLCFDKTELKKTEVILRHNAEKYQKIIDALPDTLFSIDEKGTFINCQVSDSVPLLMEKEAFIGKTLDEVMPQAIAEQSKQAIADSLENDSVNYFEYSLDFPGGEQFFEMRMSMMSPNECLGIARNITDRKLLEDELALSSERLSIAINAGGIGIWDYDVVNNRLIWDEQMYQQYGIDIDTFGGAYESWQAGLHPEDKKRGDDEIQMALRGEKEFDTEFRVLWPDESLHYIRAMAVVQRDSSGTPIRMIGTNWDVTEQKIAEEQLRTDEEKFSTLFRLNPSACGLSDADTGEYTELNDSFYKLLGFERNEVIGKNPFELGIISEETAKAITSSVDSNGRIFEAETILTTKNGEILHVLLSAEDIVINGRKLRYTVVTDFTERKRLFDENEKFSKLDPLTGLSNRRDFESRVSEIDTESQISLISIDALDLKGINDIYGHIAGDNALKIISDALTQSVRPKTDIVARIGGDEFLVVLADTNKDEAKIIKQRIINKLEELTKDVDYSVKISMGIATTDRIDDIEELMGEADDAMYREKRKQKIDLI
ncbi:MAG: diguanylate cyclase [Candidatus Saccharibacteria bacterium]